MIYWFYSYSKFLQFAQYLSNRTLKLFTVEDETTFSGRLFHNGIILLQKLYLHVSYRIYESKDYAG